MDPHRPTAGEVEAAAAEEQAVRAGVEDWISSEMVVGVICGFISQKRLSLFGQPPPPSPPTPRLLPVRSIAEGTPVCVALCEGPLRVPCDLCVTSVLPQAGRSSSA